MIEDRLLIRRCKHGCRASFQRIYEKYEGDLRTLAANLLEDKTAAEDVVHDVFISFLRIVDKFELRSSLAGYLKTSVANKARDYYRKKRPQTTAVNNAELVILNGNGPAEWIEQSELSLKLDAAIRRLTYEQREAIVLYLHGRMKFKAIGEFQKVSTKTAYKRYRAGLNKLKSLLNSESEK